MAMQVRYLLMWLDIEFANLRDRLDARGGAISTKSAQSERMQVNI